MMPPLRTTQVPWSLKRSTTLPSSYWSGKPTVNLLGGSDRTLGNRKRTVPRIMPTIDSVSATQAMLIQLNRKKRRSLPLAVGGLAGGAGLGGSGGLGAGGA